MIRKPLISIVIPTRNRQKYCIAAIKDILSYDYPYLELCIQDNSDNNEIEEFIKLREPDSRLVYKRIVDPIASIFNIGGSLGMTSGKYVIMIGDDDTILPQLFRAVEYMDKNNIDSLCPIPIINYYWPGAHPLFPNGYLEVPSQNYNYHNYQDIKGNLEKLFKRGTVRYLTYNLPKVYHGIVKKDILEKIKDKVSYYAGGLSPDIYLSVALSSLVNNHYISYFSVSIAGACSSSATSHSANNGHKGKLTEAPHFNLRGKYNWDSRVPNYYSVDTIWADSALKSAQELSLDDLNNKFDENYLAAYSLLHNHSIFKYAYKHTFNKGKKYIKLLKVTLYIPLIMSRLSFSKLKASLLKKHPINRYENISEISEVSSYININ